MLRILSIALLTSRAGAFQSPTFSQGVRSFTASSSALNNVPLAGGMSFNRVCREWRCKYTGDKTDSESLAAVATIVDDMLPTLKGLSPGVTINRLVCGSCLDFKLMITMPLDDYGPWSEKDHAPESDFLSKIKAIDGISVVESQTITNMEL